MVTMFILVISRQLLIQLFAFSISSFSTHSSLSSIYGQLTMMLFREDVMISYIYLIVIVNGIQGLTYCTNIYYIWLIMITEYFCFSFNLNL